MKSIQTIAIVLWMIIFIVAAFFVGQFLASKDIFDITSFVMGEKKDPEADKAEPKDELLANDVVTNKIGQETVRIGLNVASNYFSDYYNDYINYILGNSDKYSEDGKVVIDNTLASDYVFYAVSRNIDGEKYSSHESTERMDITEAELNSFVDKMFGKEIDDAYKKDGKYGYSKSTKTYSMEKIEDYDEFSQELEKIENITSNQIVLTFKCMQTYSEKNNNKNVITINLTCVYKGGRYIVTEVQL